MPARKKEPTILLVEADVIIRFALAEYLRGCQFIVIEAADAADARSVLVAGPRVDILMCDAQLAGESNGFALAQWVRRHRPQTEVVLTSSVANKAEGASTLCGRYPDRKSVSDAASLASRIQAMMAERKRRTRPGSSTAAVAARRRRS